MGVTNTTHSKIVIVLRKTVLYTRTTIITNKMMSTRRLWRQPTLITDVTMETIGTNIRVANSKHERSNHAVGNWEKTCMFALSTSWVTPLARLKWTGKLMTLITLHVTTKHMVITRSILKTWPRCLIMPV